MTEKRNTYLDAFLGTVDFRSPASLLEAAAQLEATLILHDKHIYAKATELDLMRDARNQIHKVARRLRDEAVRLRKREDFEEGNDFETVNAGRIKHESPNPEC